MTEERCSSARPAVELRVADRDRERPSARSKCSTRISPPSSASTRSSTPSSRWRPKPPARGQGGRSRGDARRQARRAAWPAGGHQGHHADRRHPHHLRLAAVQGQRADRGRRGGAAPEGGRRHRARQDQHAGIRRRRQHLQRRVRRHPQSVESGAQPVGFVRRLGRRGRHRHGAAGAGHRFRLLDPDAGVVLRHRRHPADAGPDAELSDAAGLGSRPGPRPAGAHRRGCRADAGRAWSASAGSRRSRWRRRGRARAPSSPGAKDVKGLRIAYVSDIAGIGVEPEIDAICRATALSLRDAGATVEEIEFDISDGKSPYQAWRGLWMVGQQFANLDRLEEFGVNLKGNVKAGLKVDADWISPPPSRSAWSCSCASPNSSSNMIC